MDRADAQPLRLLGRARPVRFAVEGCLAGVGELVARKDLDERGFACAVLAHHGVDLAGVQGKIHRVQRLDAGEHLADAARGQEH